MCYHRFTIIFSPFLTHSPLFTVEYFYMILLSIFINSDLLLNTFIWPFWIYWQTLIYCSMLYSLVTFINSFSHYTTNCEHNQAQHMYMTQLSTTKGIYQQYFWKRFDPKASTHSQGNRKQIFKLFDKLWYPWISKDMSIFLQL